MFSVPVVIRWRICRPSSTGCLGPSNPATIRKSARASCACSGRCRLRTSRPMLTGQIFEAAMLHHRSGRLGEAESLYRQILQADSNHAAALHMLGVLAHQTGRQQLAVEMISRAIAQNGQIPAFHNNLGNVYAAAGDWQGAETSFRRALDRKPDYAEAHY